MAHRRPLAVTATTLATVADLGPLAATDAALLVADAFRSCSAEPGRVVQLDLPVQPDPIIRAASRLRGVESAPDRYFVVQLTNLLGAGSAIDHALEVLDLASRPAATRSRASSWRARCRWWHPANGYRVSGTMRIDPDGHSAAQMPQPLQ